MLLIGLFILHKPVEINRTTCKSISTEAQAAKSRTKSHEGLFTGLVLLIAVVSTLFMVKRGFTLRPHLSRRLDSGHQQLQNIRQTVKSMAQENALYGNKRIGGDYIGIVFSLKQELVCHEARANYW